ncbi:MAG: SDR family oxidoreductase [Pseudomonadota bacterium]
MPDLNGKIALVTGGASGIGRETALAFARAGARVAVADFQTDGGESTVGAIRDAGGDAHFFSVDVRRDESVSALVANVIETFGGLDCAHNNAGVLGQPFSKTADVDEAEWDQIFDVNAKGVWLSMKYELKHMLGAGGGAIVNTASVAGLVGSRAFPLYCASKHAVVGLTKSAAVQYAKAGVRINAVCPGVIDTPMAQVGFGNDDGVSEQLAASHPLGRMGQPLDIADAVVWLCSGESAFITGHMLAVDGGMTAGR